MFTNFQETFTFDDVLLVPQASDLLPKDAVLSTVLAGIPLHLPFLSAPMDTVTEHQMAIAMALRGGLGFIHKNLSIEAQAAEVEMVKRFQSGFVENPVTVQADDKIAKIAEIRREFGYKKIPVVDKKGVLIGFITENDYFLPDDNALAVKDRMRPLKVVAKKGISLEKANQMIREQRLSTLCVVDEGGRLAGIVTHKDIEKNRLYPQACKDDRKRLRVGAAVGVGASALERAQALLAAGADVLVVDTAHGHSAGVIKTVKDIKKKFKNAVVVAGNIATGEAARALIDAGADALKVGIGPGSICTTRVVAGVGVPQLSAVLEVVAAVKASKKKIAVIADGGIKHSGDAVKALAAGASAVMMGNMFAGTDEAPGRMEYVGGRIYKTYRGMGSLEAMEKGGKERYGQAHVDEKGKFVPEGVSGKVLYKGTVDRIIYQLAGGVRSGMGYCGAHDLGELVSKAKFVKISSSSLRENHPHDLFQIESAPNYES